ncbi:MAG: mechanosensitive ion channel domain-containing protein [Microcystaceae cyanobacterium]
MINSSWLTPTLLLTFGFPLLMVGLGEVIFILERRNSPFTQLVGILRNLVIPFWGIYFLLSVVVALPKDNLWIKLSETCFWIALIYWGISLVNQYLFATAQEGTWQANIPKLLLDLIRTFVVLVGSAIVLSRVWGADLGGLITALGVGSLVIGLALQDSLGNVFSGVTLLFERPVKIGDWIEIDGYQGQVVEITWRSVHLATFDKSLVVIPNAQLAKGSFINFNRPEPMYGESVELGYSYDDPPYKVIQVLQETALEIDGVLSDPPPVITITTYGDCGINYKIRLYGVDFSAALANARIFKNRIWYASKRMGLTIPYPIEAHYPYESTAPKLVDLQNKAVQVLQQVSGWETIPPNALQEICQTADIKDYSEGEIIVKVDAPLPGLFVILEGSVTSSILDNETNGDGKSAPKEFRVIDTLYQGDIFGIQAILISGQVSDATVTAMEDVELLVISSNKLQNIMQQFPYLSNMMGEMMELRQQQIAATDLAA